MKIYNSFNEMFRNNKQNNNLSVFNSVKDSTEFAYGVDGSGERTGSYEVAVNGEPYLHVFYYGDNDIRSNNLVSDDEDDSVFSGVAFCSPGPSINEYCDGDDLVENIFYLISEKVGSNITDVASNDAIDFDFPLTKKEALSLANSIDSCVRAYMKRHPEC